MRYRSRGSAAELNLSVLDIWAAQQLQCRWQGFKVRRAAMRAKTGIDLGAQAREEIPSPNPHPHPHPHPNPNPNPNQVDFNEYMSWWSKLPPTKVDSSEDSRYSDGRYDVHLG